MAFINTQQLPPKGRPDMATEQVLVLEKQVTDFTGMHKSIEFLRCWVAFSG